MKFKSFLKCNRKCIKVTKILITMTLKRKLFLFVRCVFVVVFGAIIIMCIASRHIYEKPTLLDDRFEKCFLPSLAEYEEAFTNSSMKSMLYNLFTKPISLKTEEETKYEMFKVAKEFGDLMFLLKIRTFLIEPSFLFCTLSSKERDLLLRRNFDPDQFPIRKQVVTFGILDEHVSFLLKALHRIEAANFEVSHYVTHLIFEIKMKDCAINLVVFYKRETFLWHAALKEEISSKIISKEDLYFANTDAAFESFTLVPLSYKERTNISIPFNSHYFLYEVSSSKFLECNKTINTEFNLTYDDERTDIFSSKFNLFKNRTVKAIQELKAKLNPLLMHFWIWSGTLLGWYRQCGIIPYTYDIDFCAWASEVDDLDKLSNLFMNNSQLQRKEQMGLVEKGLEFHLDTQGLRVDLFFLYHENNGTWYAGHRPSKGYFFKYHHPNITLCSAAILGQKVLVPCNSEAVLSTEYGPKWMTPVRSWNYMHSIYNRGPDIYWDKDLLKKVYL